MLLHKFFIHQNNKLYEIKCLKKYFNVFKKLFLKNTFI